MTTLSEEAMIEKIINRDIFTATIDGGGFTLKIEKYEPAMSAAIHDGGNMRPEVVENSLLLEVERYYEEDPYTGSFISVPNAHFSEIYLKGHYEKQFNSEIQYTWAALYKLSDCSVLGCRVNYSSHLERYGCTSIRRK